MRNNWLERSAGPGGSVSFLCDGALSNRLAVGALAINPAAP
jgi:hypothetical protein